MTKPSLTEEQVLAVLDRVMDPEVPVVSVVELGVVRKVEVEGEAVQVTLTPTYSGCPAMRTMEEDMREALLKEGIREVAFETVYAPAWTSDWIGEEAREKLRKFGIAPPGPAGGAGGAGGLVTLTVGRRPPVECPYCGSKETTLRSEFGSTACKAIHFCNACHQPFDEFKAF